MFLSFSLKKALLFVKNDVSLPHALAGSKGKDDLS